MNFSRGVYARSARFDDQGHVLTEDEMFRIAPSIFAQTAHESRSERFKPIPTIEVLRGLIREGFSPVGVQQAVARDPGKAPFTKHMIRLRRMDEDRKYKVGDNVFEVLLKNANDGTAAYELMAGLFRIRCLNSLVSLHEELATTKVRHSGDVQHKVIEGTFTVLDTAQTTLQAPVAWGAIGLDRDERQIFAEAAHELRFARADDETAHDHAIRPERLLTVRRVGDQESDLWTIFNVVQENALRGGLHGVGRDANNRTRRVTTRQIKGIDQSVSLNRALWTLTSKMAELKGVKIAA